MGTQLIIAIGVMSALMIGIFFLVVRTLRRVEPGTALVVHRGPGMESRVVFDGGAVILPVLNKADVIDLSIKRIVLDRRGKHSAICRDCIRADIGATFLVRINRTADDVLRVARSVGCARAADQSALEELFTAKFVEALETVARQLDFEDLSLDRDRFKDQVIMVIGRDLNGYVLDDVAIDHLAQTPIEFLDPGNILDAQGIKKIKSLTERT